MGGFGTELIWLVCFNIFMLALSSLLYSLGGTSGFSKLYRRLGTSLVLGFSVNVTSLLINNWHWQYLVVPIALFGIYCLPYGANTLWDKIIKRSIVALSFIACYVLGLWASNFSTPGILVFILSSIMAVLTVPIGVLNPWNNAPLEQAIISLITSTFFITWPFIK